MRHENTDGNLRARRSFGFRSFALLFGCGILCWSLGAGPVGADGGKPVDTFKGKTSTVLVEVPVEVTADGVPVRGLTAADFEVLDEGKRREPVAFDVVDLENLGVSQEESAPALPVAARRHFLLLFDFSFSKPSSVEKARQAALDLVHDDLHPADMVAVATYALNRGVKVELAFTPDRRQAYGVLGRLESTESVKLRQDPLRLFVRQNSTDIDADLGNVGDLGSIDGFFAAAKRAHFRDLQIMVDQSQARKGRREVSAMARSMGELGALLRSVEGRKHVVFFSEGFDGELLLGATDAGRRDELVRQAQGGSVLGLATLDSDEYFGSAEALDVLDLMNEELRRSDCTVHAVDIGGLRVEANSRAQVGGSKDGLFMMAEGTGGEFFENFNNLGVAMGDLLERTSVTYVLAFEPTDLKPNGKYRKLEVRLKDKKARHGKRLVHRPGYFAPDSEGVVNRGVATQLDLAQRLWDGRRQGPIDARLLAVPLQARIASGGSESAGPERAYVPVVIEVDGSSFESAPAQSTEGKKKRKKRRKAKQDGADGPARAEVFVYALDDDAGVVDFFSQSIALGDGEQAALFRRQGMKIYAPLLLPSGDFELRLLVRNSRFGTTGLEVGRVTVPDAADQTSTLLPPFFPESTDSWVLVRGRRQDVDTASEPAYPFVHGPSMYIPSARPRVTAGSVLPIFLAGYDLGQVRDLDSDVVDVWGRSVGAPRWRLDDRAQSGDDGLQRHVAAFEVPGLEPGVYTLSLSLIGADGRRSGPASQEFEIIAGDGGAESPLLRLDTPPDFGSREEPADGPSGGR